MTGLSFGILTASYNAREALQRTVESVASQDWPMIEHIVADGGSSDGTQDYLESLGGKVRWISEPDKGIADALNKALGMAQADYLLVLQADDELIDPGALSRAASLASPEVDIISFDVKVTGDGRSRIYQTRGLGALSEFFMTVPHQGAFVRKALYDRIGGFDPAIRVAMDYDFMLRAKRAGARILTRNETIAIMPDDGVSSRKDWPSLKARLAENRMLHMRHRKGLLHGAIGAVFWTLYPLYKRLRHLG